MRSSADGRRAAFAYLTLLTLCFSVIAAACGAPGGERSQERASAGRVEIPLPPGKGPLLVVTGYDQGFIRPCGCSKPALGGIHRRATVIASLRARKEEAKLNLISLGDLVVSGEQQQRMKFESFMIAMSEMGYELFFPGKGEFRLGLEFLRQAREVGGFPFVAANLAYEGEKFTQASHRLPNGLLATGLLPEGLKEAEYRSTSIPDALKSVVAELEDGERLVVAYGGPASELPKIAKLLPEAARKRAILLGHGDDALLLPTVDGALLLGLGSKGRFVHFLRPGSAKPYTEMVLRENIPAHELVGDILDGYRMMVREEGLVKKAPRQPQPIAYVGDEACIECHEESCELLDSTPHERAFATLEASGDHHDPECVRCHVTGWGDKGGYLGPTETPKLKNVTCEACHGPGELHVETQEEMPRSKPGPTFCQRCHDPDNSPHFKFEKYWPKIAHPPK